jgi:hypothetical protein
MIAARFCLIGFLMLPFLLPGCAIARAGGKALSTIADVLCQRAAAKRCKELDGMTVAQWCKVKKNIDPILDIVFGAAADAEGAVDGALAPEETPIDAGVVEGGL